MSRSYATTQCSIWDDDQFVALSGQAIATYLMLSTQHDIGAAGVAAITLGRWARYVARGDRDTLDAGLRELVEAGFVAVDWHTEELLVARRFLEDDAGYKHAVRRKAVLSNAAGIRSPRLKRIVATELDRLGVTLPATLAPFASATQSHSVPLSPTREALESHSEALQNGAANPVEPDTDESHSEPLSATESLGSVVTLVGYGPHSTLHTQGAVATQSDSTRSNGKRPPEHCKDHPGGTDQPCGPCRRARIAAAEYDADQAIADRAALHQRRRQEREAAALERDACQLCDHDGYRLTPTGPGQWCNHQPLNPGGLQRALAAITAEKPPTPEKEPAQP
jgi:hypothetical protein